MREKVEGTYRGGRNVSAWLVQKGRSPRVKKLLRIELEKQDKSDSMKGKKKKKRALAVKQAGDG